MQFSIVTPFPGTEYFDILKSKNLLLSSNWSDFDGLKTPVFRTDQLTRDDLISSLFLANRRLKRYINWLDFKRKFRYKINKLWESFRYKK